MGSDYLTSGDLLVFRGTCYWDQICYYIFFRFHTDNGFSLLFQWLIRTSFRCSYSYSSIVEFRSSFSVHSRSANQHGYIQRKMSMGETVLGKTHRHYF